MITKKEINFVIILTTFISGIILAILGATLYKSDLMIYIGIGSLSGSMTISIIELIWKNENNN